jgi:frizzled protein 5/8
VDMTMGVSSSSSSGGGSKDNTCEAITIPMCKEIGYNFTRLPNQFNHQNQDEVH